MPGVPGEVGLGGANARLRVLVPEFQAQVADLAARTQENPENSPRPPSSDRLAKSAPKSLRKKSAQPRAVTGLTAVGTRLQARPGLAQPLRLGERYYDPDGRCRT